MKRILAFILLLTLCLSLIACNGNSDNNNDNADKDGTSQSIDGPAANDDNTMLQYPEKPQKYVVNYIRDMAMTGWTPEKTFQLYGKYQAWSYNLTYEEGKSTTVFPSSLTREEQSRSLTTPSRTAFTWAEQVMPIV